MITVLVNHRVQDYEEWKAAYERIDSGPLARDVRSYRIWRSLDDPNLVILAETFESREIAEAAFAHPDLAAEIAKSGVDTDSMEVQFLGEVAFVTKQ
jgi:quinol monooxygenase YgiN